MAGQKNNKGLLDTLRKAVEICMPDLRHYYRMTKKARVVASYAPADEGGKYYCDVQPLRNDETVDEREPVVPKVEIPILWAGKGRGVVCPPVAGTFCDLSYYDGDPNYPCVSNFRWHDMDAPMAELNEFVIQLEPGVEIRIDKQKHVVTLTQENVRTEAGKDIQGTAGANWTIQAGKNVNISAGENAAITALSAVTVQAPQINITGNQTSTGPGGGIGASSEKSHKTHEGSYTLQGSQTTIGPQTVNGLVTVNGNIIVSGVVTAQNFVKR